MASPSDGRRMPCLCIVVAGSASDLEWYAAAELKAILERLFEVEVQIAGQVDAYAAAAIIIGRPETNELLASMIGEIWPNLSEQGLLIRRVQEPQPTLVIGGGSDVATLWAVYEFGERLGVRYLHYRDVYPSRQPWPGLPRLDLTMEPNLRIRCWRLVNELPPGPVSWSLEENHRFLRQLAKMKFNRIKVHLWPAQPFIHYTIRGMAKPKGELFFGERYPIDDDTVGREKFANVTEFTNPHFVGAETTEELHRRAVHLVRGILAEARRLGMQTALAFEPAVWPKAFAAVLPGTEPVQQLGWLTIGPGPDQSMDDPLLREATATVIKAYVQTYPEVDYLVFSMPEHGHWIGQAGEAYRRLTAAYEVKDLEGFDDLCNRARSRTNFPGGGQRVERQLKSDLSSLWFLDSLLREYKLLKRPESGSDIKLVYSNITEELFPLVARVVPSASEVVSFLDYTASRQLQRRDLLQHLNHSQVSASLLFTLADDNIGPLPQLATGSLHELMGLLRDHNWSGFHTRYWTVGDLDPTIHLLARGSWDASLTPRDAYADQVLHTCGTDAVGPALAAFAIMEKITLRLDQYGLGFAFLVPTMMTQHYDAGELAEEIRNDRESYIEALRLMEEAHKGSTPPGRDYTGYFVNRLRFAVRYLDAAEAFGAVGRVLKENRNEEALVYANQAYFAIREALQAYVDVARDHGDLGAVAAMNEYCYRPIRDTRDEINARIMQRGSHLSSIQSPITTP